MVSWEAAHQKYIESMDRPLDEEYRKDIVKIARRFRSFSDIDYRHMILDVGCGSDRIGGMSYKEFFGWDDKEWFPNWYGVDPLDGRATHHGIAENLDMFRDGTFDRVQIATSIDHFKYWEKALEECMRVLKEDGEINIWFTETVMEDDSHVVRLSLSDLVMFMDKHDGWAYVYYVEPFRKSRLSKTVFFKMYRL